jgi:hypothetical protein
MSSERFTIEVAPARVHVARDVLDDDGDAVGLGVRGPEEVLAGDLGERALGERLVLAQLPGRVLEVVRFDRELAHGSMLSPSADPRMRG